MGERIRFRTRYGDSPMKETAVMRRLASLIRFILPIVLLWGANGGAPSVSGQEKSEPPAFAGYAEKDLEWAQAITNRPTFQVTRNLRFQADQEVFRFLHNHPDFAAAVSRGIGHEKIFVTRKEDDLFDIRHGHAKGTFWPVDRNPDRAAYLAVGDLRQSGPQLDRNRRPGPVIRDRDIQVEAGQRLPSGRSHGFHPCISSGRECFSGMDIQVDRSLRPDGL